MEQFPALESISHSIRILICQIADGDVAAVVVGLLKFFQRRKYRRLSSKHDVAKLAECAKESTR